MSLYLKYRPKTVAELDLEKVREAFGAIIKANNVAHAYLFTGPRGAGKTSSARILARIVNCHENKDKLGEPCNTCPSCSVILKGSSLDFVEIDAASNRGIDDIRELKEKIRLAPSELKYKVYIIDEVHMLTTEAFNALLKTLEEPPERAIFILCTTETHKVPETIVSRCVRIAFNKASQAEMERAFTRVTKGEGKQVEPEALAYLARSVDGSFRDGVKILEKVLSAHEKVTLADMEEAIVGAAGFRVAPLATALIAGESQEALRILHETLNQGVDLSYVVVSLMREIRDHVLGGGDVALTKLIFALDDVARRIASSPVPELLLEMTIIEWGLPDGSASGGISQAPSRLKSSGQLEKKPSSKPESTKVMMPVVKRESSENKEVSQEEVAKKTEKIVEAETPKVTSATIGDHQSIWKQLMTSLNGDSITLGALLSKATPAQLAGDELTIQVGYGFHRDQIMSEKVLSKLENALERVVGSKIRVRCQVGQSQSMSPNVPSSESQGDTIDEAMAIFS